jgi:uncharacterized protein DUF5317
MPVACYALGLAFNEIALLANHGLMPVLTNDCEGYVARWAMAGDPLHTCLTGATRLKFFTDWFIIPGVGTVSVGDGLISIYEYLAFPFLYVWFAFVVKDHLERA